MEEAALIPIINNELELNLTPGLSGAEICMRVQVEISRLINADFQQLVNILYRVDVNERKLKYLLQENVGEDAAVIITNLIIDRQLEKIAARKAFSRTDEAIDENDKW